MVNQKLWTSTLIALIISEIIKVSGSESFARFEQPHVEPEIHPERPMGVAANMFAGPETPREFEAYRLMVSAEPSEQGEARSFTLVGTPSFNNQSPVTNLQRMYARYDSLEKAVSALEQVLPDLQLRAVQGILQSGGATEIGGHFNAIRIFSPTILRQIGLSFRQL
ncbi:MAG: hypothetical protein WAN23_14245 [Candidatus Acidiferrales bacterium]